MILCNLEKIFPPSFFDVMEHLPIHLSYEAKLGGPVHYRWMYPFERLFKRLKATAKNKAHPAASIVESYLRDETNNFSEQFFPPNMSTAHRRRLIIITIDVNFHNHLCYHLINELHIYMQDETF